MVTWTRKCSAFVNFNRNRKVPGDLKEFDPNKNICKHNNNSNKKISRAKKGEKRAHMEQKRNSRRAVGMTEQV